MLPILYVKARVKSFFHLILTGLSVGINIVLLFRGGKNDRWLSYEKGK
jgi:hypothetical protein